jgi:hypothetical protein
MLVERWTVICILVLFLMLLTVGFAIISYVCKVARCTNLERYMVLGSALSLAVAGILVFGLMISASINILLD